MPPPVIKKEYVMAIIRWDPFSEIDHLMKSSKVPLLSSNFLATNVFEKDNNIIVQVSIPGVDPKNVDITLEGDEYLRIEVKQKEEHEKKEQHYYVKEIVSGSGERIIHLPVPVIEDQVKADFKDGILEIVLPEKKQTEQSRKISIQQKQ
jgi:HSP20 family protein